MMNRKLRTYSPPVFWPEFYYEVPVHLMLGIMLLQVLLFECLLYSGDCCYHPSRRLLYYFLIGGYYVFGCTSVEHDLGWYFLFFSLLYIFFEVIFSTEEPAARM